MAQFFTLLALIVGFILCVLIDRHFSKKRAAAADEEAVASGALAWERVKALLNLALPNIITDAENKYIDPGTGELKMSFAIQELMKLLPPEYQGRILDGVLKSYVEKALESTKTIWGETPGVLFSARMEQGEPDDSDIVPPAVIDELRRAEMHLEINCDDGRIAAVPDGREADRGEDAASTDEPTEAVEAESSGEKAAPGSEAAGPTEATVAEETA